MKEYLKLDANCGRVEGKTGTMLFDFSNKRAFHVNEVESNALTEMLQGKAIEEVVDRDERINKFVGQIQQTGLAVKKGAWAPMEKLHRGSLYELHPEYRIIANNIFIEIPGECEEKCRHCGKPKINGCFSCGKVSSTKEYNKHFYFRMIGEVASFGFRNIYFHGGNIFKYCDRLIELLRYTRLLVEKDKNIFLICDYRHINFEVLETLRELRITLIVGFDCTGKGQAEILSLIRSVAEKIADIKWCANLCFDATSIRSFTEVKLDLLKSYRISDISYSLYIQSEHEKYEYFSEMPKIFCDETTFFLLEKVHPCLGGTLAICANGEVRPCPCIEDIIGKIDYEKEMTFSRIFENTEKIREYWEFSVDKLEPCKECEYRRTCSDCRAVDFRLGNIHKKSLCSRQ